MTVPAFPTGPRDDAPEPGDAPAAQEAAAQEAAAQEAADRRRRAEVFGDVLPEATSDDRDDRPEGHSDAWFRGEVPPHHT